MAGRHGADDLRAVALSAAATFVLACGCGGPRDLTWTFHLATAALERRAVVVEARISRESCAGPELVFAGEFRFPGPGPDAPPLPPGRYFFSGRARDADCVWFAAGCPVDGVTLPLANAGPVDIALDASAETPACAASMCRCGECETTAGACPDGG